MGYEKNHLRTSMNPKLGIFLSQFRRFLDDVCGKAIVMCLIPILLGVIDDGIIRSETPFKGLSPFNEVK